MKMFLKLKKSSIAQLVLVAVILSFVIYQACHWYVYRDNCTALGGTYVKTGAGWKCLDVEIQR
jgi:hypothetical protein